MLKAKSDFAVYERKDIKFREDIKHLISKEKKLQSSIQSEQKKIKEKTVQLAAAEEDISRHAETVEKLNTQLEKEEKLLEDIFAQLKDETADLNVRHRWNWFHII